MSADRDILSLILDDHRWFRDEFVRLDQLRAGSASPAELAAVWAPLAARLDVHAIAEEEIFYPELLDVGSSEAEEETLDAIGDHNDIRDGVRRADAEEAGSPRWWEAVRAARVANDEHMAEEEREGIADLRTSATAGMRAELGERFAAFLDEHRTAAALDTRDKDPEGYVEGVEDALDGGSPHDGSPDDGSLRIGSLKG